ncbi:CAP domain-containing protein [Saccharothrix sp. NRRL B-16348]|uniref:CAP domain-containing protein n=1 Tax=Saccharothrix sp. NRRL B-16348 TaxID=1415542 RepID=UPI0007C68040|nr:CAP domain-containing protein [Saccharothrix sp. NRRL B-16348]
MIGGLVGLLLGAAGATGVAVANPEQLAPFVGESAAQRSGSDNIGVGGVGGVGGPAQSREPELLPTTTEAPPSTETTTGTTTTTETTTTTTETTTTTAEPSPEPTTTTPADVPQAQQVVALVNEARDLAGCKPLKVDERVVEAAQGHSADMAQRDYFSHTTPEGVDFAQRMRAAGYPSPGGENIAMGQRSAEQVMRAWMNSDGHRRNILNCGFTTIGVGLDTRGWYWTQNFGW